MDKVVRCCFRMERNRQFRYHGRHKLYRTTDNTDVVFKRRNIHAGLLSDHQTYNTSFGVNSYKGSANGIQGIRNTAIGSNSLHGSSLGVVTGSDNTAVGANSLLVNDAEQNVAVGSDALRNNTSGDNNTAIGFAALTKNTTGRYNIANGSSALKENTDGFFNVAIGGWALSSNKKGSSNTAVGGSSLSSNVTGYYNTAIGYLTMEANKSGSFNVAIGYDALSKNSLGSENIAIGHGAGTLIDNLKNTIAIGTMAFVSESNSIQLGNADITKITGQVPFTTTSDRRFKENIQTIPLGLDFINQLHPVEYIRKNSTLKTKEWGVIAQELEKTLQEVGYEDAGIVQEDGSANKMLSVRYTDLIAPMIKAIQELTEQNKLLNNRIIQLERGRK